MADHDSRDDVNEPIPTYAEANAFQPSPGLPPQFTTAPDPSQQSLSAPSPHILDEPPAYAVLDSTQTTFMIYGTFIHTANGPCYQLSSPLDQRGPYFRIRRLSAKDVSHLVSGSTPVSFDKEATLYEVNDPPLLSNEYHMQGKRRSCLPGVLELRYKISRGRWEVRHVPKAGSGAKGTEILTSKRDGSRFGSTKLNRKTELEESQWKDATGTVVATEKLEEEEGGTLVPTLELSKDLGQQSRELVLSLWAARLWVAFGVEKTAKMGGRYGDTRSLATFTGAALMGGRS
jgi:hypothetical protein